MKPRRWTSQRLIDESRAIYGDMFNYDEIDDGTINKFHSSFNITCNICGTHKETNIKAHILRKQGCVGCRVKKLPIKKYTLAIFIERATNIHGDKYDYSHIKEEDINGRYSVVKLRCRTCEYEWDTTVSNHVKDKSGCRKCANKLQWTLKRFLKRAATINGNKYDYSAIHEINNGYTKIPLRCNVCKYEWETTVHIHVNLKKGCPNCAGNPPWTLEKLLVKAHKIHGDKYDYSNIKGKISGLTKVPISCNTCKLSWNVTVGNHIGGKRGCPHCAYRKGYSDVAIRWLESIEHSHGIIIQKATSSKGEFRTEAGRVDGYCEETNTVYEFQGCYWHGCPECFEPDDENKTNYKTYRELYEKTMNKIRKLEELEYNVVVMWEHDFNEGGIVSKKSEQEIKTVVRDDNVSVIEYEMVFRDDENC